MCIRDRSKSVHFDQKAPVKYFREDESPSTVNMMAEFDNLLNLMHKPVNRVFEYGDKELAALGLDKVGDTAVNKGAETKLRKSKRFQNVIKDKKKDNDANGNANGNDNDNINDRENNKKKIKNEDSENEIRRVSDAIADNLKINTKKNNKIVTNPYSNSKRMNVITHTKVVGLYNICLLYTSRCV